MSNYNGLTRNTWPGTWSPDGSFPIVLSDEVRGGIHFVTGEENNQLTDLPGQRLEEGMLAYVKQSYAGVTGDRFYIYKLQDGEGRNENTGEMPNTLSNWHDFANSIGEVTEANISIDSINNVDVENVQSGALLQYNGQTENWEARNNIDTTFGTLKLNGGSY
jgi:hypothetical protein